MRGVPHESRSGGLIMRKIISLILGALFIVFAGARLLPAQAQPKEITILYDNRPSDPACLTHWGFSCLIKGFEKTILFDVGERRDVLLKNVEALKVDLKTVDILIISHFHPDHTSAIGAFLNLKPNAKIYVPNDAHPDPRTQPFRDQVQEAGVMLNVVKAPTELIPHVFSTGTMGIGIKEQSLILDTDRGLVIITGCAHQGVVNIVQRAKSMLKKEIALVLGGFHLLDSSETAIRNIIDKFRENGVRQIGATHCTGDKAIQMMKDVYKENFLEIGVGKKIVLK
jgi:7,8-dihydropterin-6-yl-methyl-4-(beta-D-ribofuranosyl)aminobenzene 5'-phosphate synthase